MAKRQAKWQRGKLTERRDPIWEPLLELLPEDIDDFMWMGEVALTDGTRVQLYKHYWTRRYLMLDLGGRTFVNRDKDRYEEAEDPEWMLRLVFRFGETRGDIVRRNEWVDNDDVGWVRSALRHGISHERSLHVVRHAGICWRQTEHADEWYCDPLFIFLGPDQDWSPLEVIGIVGRDCTLMIVHAMPLRERWQGWYEEASRWRR